MITATDLLRPWRRRYSASPLELIGRIAPTVLYLSVIYAVSGLPSDKISLAFDDRLAHFLEYFGLGILLMFSLAGLTDRDVPGWQYAAAWIFAIGWGLSDEFHQSFVAGRDPSTKDLLFDSLGVSCSLVVLWLALRESSP